MMLKEKSSPWARLKYLYVLPLAAITVTAFARPEVSEKVEEISVVKVNDLASYMQEKVSGDTVKSKENEEIIMFEVVEQMPEFPGGTEALSNYLTEQTEKSSAKGKAGGTVTVGFTVSETGKVKDVEVLQSQAAVLNKEAERIVREMPDWKPGKQRGVSVPVKYTVPVRFGAVRFAENKEPLILVDGIEVDMEAFNKMDVSKIQSVSVLKDSTSIGLYGKRAKGGVILVNTQKTNTSFGGNHQGGASNVSDEVSVEIQVNGAVVDEQGRPKAGVSIVIPNTYNGTITDSKGHFSLKAPSNATLWFSFVGYKTVKAPITSTMLIRMEQDVVKLFPEGASVIGIRGN